MRAADATLRAGEPTDGYWKNFAGLTALEIARKRGNEGMVRLLEEHAPTMPSIEKMRRLVARDPVGQALVFDLMLKLFLQHVLGVSPEMHADGVASAGGFGVFGPVQAYFGPVESQGRGGLHPHMHVWLLHSMTSSLLAQLRAGEDVEGLEQKLERWRSAVLAKVASMQFDSVEEMQAAGFWRTSTAPRKRTISRTCLLLGVPQRLPSG